LGSVNQPPVSIGKVEVMGWIDASHYIYCPAIPIDGKSKIFVGEIDGETIHTYESGISIPVTWFTFVILGNKVDK